MTKKGTEVAVTASAESLALLREQFPQEQGFNRVLLPRLSMISQDQTEETKKNGKKEITVIAEAGTFFLEKETDEVDPETKKKVWSKDELGTSIEATVIFQRKQLRMYDEETELYTSSPIYDNDTEVIPLFCEGKEVKRGTAPELKAEYEFTEANGKTKSKLEDNKILYVLYEGELYQMNLRGSSMWSFVAYARKNLVPAELTQMSSEAKEKGQIAWNQMTFNKVRDLGEDEVQDVLRRVAEIKDAIMQEKAYYASLKDSDEADTIITKADGTKVTKAKSIDDF